MRDVIVIEEHGDEGCAFYLSFDGPNPSEDRCVRGFNHDETFKAKALIESARDAERKAWARLVRARIAETDAAVGLENEEPGAAQRLALRQTECKAAEQALRDLGVDVDALLTEGA